MKYNFRHGIILMFLFTTTVTYGQRPPESFIRGLDIFKTNPSQAKTLFYDAIQADSTFYGSYNFIGILLCEEKKYDSAIIYLKTSLRLNTQNINHTKEFTYARLCRTYLRNTNFENAYRLALQCSEEYPDNSVFLSELQDACLWSYNIEYANLKKDYLNTTPMSEYLVNGVSQEYLILRNITINGSPLVFTGQAYDSKKNMDILSGSVGKTQENISLKFKLGWEVSKTFGDNMPDYKIVYENKNLPIWVRLGAILSGTTKVDIRSEITRMAK